MKKRVLSILLTLCMALCIVPTSVFAEGETTKKVGTEQELIDALADSTVNIITLKSNIAVSSTLIVKRAVTLDIYGYMLEMKGSGSVIAIQDGGDLTLEDSDPKALYMFTPDADGLWKRVSGGGTKAVSGGVIYGGTGTELGAFAFGGGVHVKEGGQFTMNGGNIVGCTATGNYADGGGVYVAGGSRFIMNGGSIAGCTAVGDDNNNDTSAEGGGVHVAGGQFTMNGGSIIDCTAAALSGLSVASGGGIHNAGTTTLSGTAEIRDCHAKRAYGLDGGGISDLGTLNISGDVKVSGCTAGGTESDAMRIYSGTVSGGMFYGSVTNWGKISGGMFYGSITNYDTITGGMFYGGIANYEGRGKIDGFTVTYRVDGNDYAIQVLQSGTTASKPIDPAAEEGYVFAGWYNGEAAYDFVQIVTDDITLTAKWAKLSDKTADFTASDGGAAAIALLNSAKTGAADSVWDNGTKTLTLKGIHFATTAATAVKLPDGATIILADGTENRIIGGGAAAAQDGTYKNEIYIYGIYAAGALTIQGETEGTGKLYVNSGEHINSGDAWTYSVGLYAEGDLTVSGGATTAQGGKASGGDVAFSLGVKLSEGHSLFVSGSTLNAIGGESYDTEDPNDIRESFSEGVDIYHGDITVSGNGKLIAETLPDIGFSFGIYINSGNLTVKDSAFVSAAASGAINIYDGDLKLSGGKISVLGTNDVASAVTISKNMFATANGNIEVSGGEFECDGGIYMDSYHAQEGQAVFSVTGGKVTASHIYGPNKLTVSVGTVVSGRINADTVLLQSGSLTVREAVHMYPNRSDVMYASHAIYCENLTVNGGVLDAAWDWGEYTPIAFPASWYSDDYVQPLIRIPGGTASFSGGTVKFDAGCAGNTVIKAETLSLTGGVRGSGYTNEDGSDAYIQTDSDKPVEFAVQPADYSKVDAAIAKANALNKDDYKDFSAVEAAINAVVRGKNIDEQAEVDAMAKAIEDAIAALEKRPSEPQKDTADSSFLLLAVLAFISGGACTALAVKHRRAALISNQSSVLLSTPAWLTFGRKTSTGSYFLGQV